MKIVGLIFAFLLIVNFNVTAEVSKDHDYDLIFSDIDKLKNDLNDNLDNVPKSVRQLIKNDKINVEFETSENSITFYLVFKDGFVNEVSKGILDNSDLDVYTKEKDINDIVRSTNPQSEFKTKIKNKNITYAPNGFWNRIKYNTMLNLFLKSNNVTGSYWKMFTGAFAK